MDRHRGAASRTITVGGEPEPEPAGGQSASAILARSRARPGMQGGERGRFRSIGCGRQLGSGEYQAPLSELPAVPEAAEAAVPPGGANPQERLAAARAHIEERRESLRQLHEWNEQQLRTFEADRAELQRQLDVENDMVHAEGQVLAQHESEQRTLDAQLVQLDVEKAELEREVQQRESEMQRLDVDLVAAEGRIQEQEARIARLNQDLEQREITQRDYEQQLENLRREELEINDQLAQSRAAIEQMEAVKQRLEADEDVAEAEVQQAIQETIQSREQLDARSRGVEQAAVTYDYAVQQQEHDEMTAQLRQEELNQVEQRCRQMEQEQTNKQAELERLEAAAEHERQEMRRVEEEMQREQQEVERLEQLAQQDERAGNDHCAQVYRDMKQQHIQRANAARNALSTNNQRNQARLAQAKHRLEMHERQLQSERAVHEQSSQRYRDSEQEVAARRGESNQMHQNLLQAEGERSQARLDNATRIARENALQSSLSELQGHISWQENQVARCQRQHATIVGNRQQLEGRIADVQADMDTRREAIGRLNAEVGENRHDLGRQRTDVNAKRADLAALQSELGSVQRDEARIMSQIEENTGNLAENRQCAGLHRERVVHLQQNKVTLEASGSHHKEQFDRGLAQRTDLVRNAEIQLGTVEREGQVAATRARQQDSYNGGR